MVTSPYKGKKDDKNKNTSLHGGTINKQKTQKNPQTIKHPPPKKKKHKTKQSTHNQLKKVENRSTESIESFV